MNSRRSVSVPPLHSHFRRSRRGRRPLPHPRPPRNRAATTFSTPLKIVGFGGYFTVTPRGSTTYMDLSGRRAHVDRCGDSPDDHLHAQPRRQRVHRQRERRSAQDRYGKGSIRDRNVGDALDSTPLRAFTTLSSTPPTLFGTSPTATRPASHCSIRPLPGWPHRS